MHPAGRDVANRRNCFPPTTSTVDFATRAVVYSHLMGGSAAAVSPVATKYGKARLVAYFFGFNAFQTGPGFAYDEAWWRFGYAFPYTGNRAEDPL